MINKKKLALLGVVKMLSGVLVMSALLFFPAGTFQYPGAWRMLGVMFAPMLITGTILLVKAPDLLEKRLKMKETEPEQRNVIVWSCIMFTTCFVLCGLDKRLGWTSLSETLSIIACGVFLLTYIGFAELLRENTYLSRTVEIQKDQQVISTGLYAIVRHPMYLIIMIMFFTMPIIIGSLVGLVPLIGFPVIIIKRIKNEEALLTTRLPGYSNYQQKVRFRLIPLIW